MSVASIDADAEIALFEWTDAHWRSCDRCWARWSPDCPTGASIREYVREHWAAPSAVPWIPAPRASIETVVMSDPDALAYADAFHALGHWADECPDEPSCGVGHWNPRYRRPTVNGDWRTLPDASLGSHHELCSLTARMAVAGLTREVALDEFMRVARSDAPSWPWTESDFDVFWHSAERKADAWADAERANRERDREGWAALGIDLDAVIRREAATRAVMESYRKDYAPDEALSDDCAADEMRAEL